ncbi:MAG: hypothetical protein A2Y40_00245 [Candidatus Margulisbacteria bacterium GWF2_35_9]|nr:MAG: hypothetical protein A2Y40_00245 [Candidatus Margulisbacteria bacterium GWF2_35_9]
MPYRILIVDDDKEFREEFKECFYEYSILEAGTGQQALDVLTKSNEIDIVFLDVHLPDTTGIKLLSKLRQTHPDLCVIILTGYGTKDIVIDALQGKADDYIEKPLDIEKTKLMIKCLIESKVETGDVINGNIQEKIKRIMHFAQRNVDKKVNLYDAAKLVYMSPKYLSRIFKQEVGINFSEYRLNIKIKRSKELLKKTGLSIEHIADDLGYENLESFTRIFKKYTGTTPSQYRKSISIL